MPRNRVTGPGGYNASCDECGLKFKASELLRRWDGAMVDKACWEPRHPQEFIKPINDQPKLPFIRPDIAQADIGPGINCDTYATDEMSNKTFQSLLQGFVNLTTPTVYDVYKLRTLGGVVTIPDGVTVKVNCSWTVGV